MFHSCLLLAIGALLVLVIISPVAAVYSLPSQTCLRDTSAECYRDSSSNTASAPDILHIQNTLSPYCRALDNKDWGLLNQVFSPSFIANFKPFLPRVLHEVDAIREAVRETLVNVDTQNSITTPYIDFMNGGEAKTVSYLIATHFGRGRYLGEILTVWGRYEDRLDRNGDIDWIILYRRLFTMVSLFATMLVAHIF